MRGKGQEFDERVQTFEVESCQHMSDEGQSAFQLR